jgi:hypothetical protein
MHPRPDFSQKVIYRIWADETSKKWKRDADELKSAKILISEASPPNAGIKYSVQAVPLRNEPGFVSLAFVLTDVILEWGRRIREISLDSACMSVQSSV